MEDDGDNISLQQVTVSEMISESKYTKEISEAVKSGSLTELENYLYDNAPNTILNSFTEDGRSLLHDACECEKKKVASELVAEILKWYQRRKPENDNSFVDKKDNSGNTALHYAVKRRNKKAVQELLNSGADVNIKNDVGEEAITPIYEHLPETIISLLDGPNSIEFLEDEDEPSDRELKIKCNFSVITGIGNNPREVYETYMLSNVFRVDKEIQVSLFLNPVLQLFLDLKWQKMKYLIYLSMGFHIFWSIFTSIYIMDVCMATYGNNTVQDFEFLENEWRNSKLANRHFDSENIWWSIPLLGITGIVMLKEIFEFVATPKVGTYWRQFENKGQLALILSIYVLIIFCKFLPIWLDFKMSVMAVFTAWLLVLGQLNKHPSLGLYMEMLMKVSKSFMKFFLSFSPILIAFTFVFRMLMPSMIQFYLWPPWGLVKIVTMLTGEINFDEIFEEDVDAVMVTKNVFILAFITIVAIVLQNLLVGLVVSDMQSLTKKARENSLKTQLEQMFLMEAFIIKILAAIPNVRPIEELWMVTKNRSVSSLFQPLFNNQKETTDSNSQTANVVANPDESHIVTKHINDFSKESQLRLRELKIQRDLANENK